MNLNHPSNVASIGAASFMMLFWVIFCLSMQLAVCMATNDPAVGR